jgi:hypothetical protein
VLTDDDDRVGTGVVALVEGSAGHERKAEGVEDARR